MSRTLIPAAANLIIRHGSHILLMKRSDTTEVWPNFWAFPGGKLDNGELFREAAIRETREEIGIIIHSGDIKKEVLIAHRTITGVKTIYIGQVEIYENSPELLEPELATDLAWFPITELPSPMIPVHQAALDAIENGIGYLEIDMA
jgi:8-oxo-dGTP diphosphatase